MYVMSPHEKKMNCFEENLRKSIKDIQECNNCEINTRRFRLISTGELREIYFKNPSDQKILQAQTCIERIRQDMNVEIEISHLTNMDEIKYCILSHAETNFIPKVFQQCKMVYQPKCSIIFYASNDIGHVYFEKSGYMTSFRLDSNGYEHFYKWLKESGIQYIINISNTQQQQEFKQEGGITVLQVKNLQMSPLGYLSKTFGNGCTLIHLNV